MPEAFVSPGVQVIERDFSYYKDAIGLSSLGLIGETQKGPAFYPIKVDTMSEFRQWYGDMQTTMYVPYCAKSWFKYGDSIVVNRVLGSDEFLNASETLVYLGRLTGSTKEIFCALLTSGDTVISMETGVDPLTTDVVLTATGVYTGSVNFYSTSAPNYVGKLFPRTYTGDTAAGVVLLGEYTDSCGNGGITTGVFSALVSTYNTHNFSSYSNAKTPLIHSEIDATTFSGTPLFTIYTVSDGVYVNGELKIAIENIDQTAKTFDITVRSYDDTNSRQIVLERWSSLTLNPTGTTYLPRAIGDSRDDTGEYDLNSKYIYVSMEAGDFTGLVPAGFGQINVPGETATSYILPQWPVLTGYDATIATSRQYLGIDYSNLSKDHTMINYGSQWDLDAASWTLKIKGFHLDSSATGETYSVGFTGLTGYTKAQAKFLVPVLGGRDGWKREEPTRNFLTTTPTTTQANAWKDAIDDLANPEEYDINLLAVPGVSVANTIGTYATEMVQDRADALYVGDMPNNMSTSTQAVDAVSSIDSNYTCTYWPYVKFYDNDNEVFVWRPPTPQALEAIAFNDSVAYPWFAPAGFNRALTTDVAKAKVRLTVSDRDILYEGRVNPVATFPGQGVVIWGQKTMQVKNSALDRINVRRMLLYVRKLIAGATNYLVFEQNDEATWDRFKALVQPELDLIRIKRGLQDFRVIMDETTNTPDIIDRNQMVGYIYLVPTKTAEVITLYFTLFPSGAVFEE